MRRLTILLLLALILPTLAADKPASTATPPAPDPALIRQGGDTIADAVAIGIPYSGTGTTAGYTDDYDAVCPYPDSSAPDVVYAVTPSDDVSVDIDLCGSSYDTKVYVYDQELALVACNDDYYFGNPCGDYVSKLENVALLAGATYHVIIDGYGGESGEYVLEIREFEPCVLECPAGAELEGEPPLVDGYQDAFNGGCQWPQFGNNFSAITQPLYCGVNGWYQAGGSTYRDGDYHELVVPPSGIIELTADAEFLTMMAELGPPDCATFGIVQYVWVGPCAPASMTIVGEPGSVVWFFVVAGDFEGPVNEYNYVIESNLGSVATEDRSWSSVKGLFN